MWVNLGMNGMVGNFELLRNAGMRHSAPGLKQEGQNYICHTRESGYPISFQEKGADNYFRVIATRHDSRRGSNLIQLQDEICNTFSSVSLAPETQLEQQMEVVRLLKHYI